MDFDAAHEQPDPFGYEIRHSDDDKLVLIRLADRKEIGRYTDPRLTRPEGPL